MRYNIDWTKGALEELNKLEPYISQRILKKISDLSQNIHSCDIKRLKGIEGYRLRIGDYRVIFDINENTILVLKVGHRKNIYD